MAQKKKKKRPAKKPAPAKRKRTGTSKRAGAGRKPSKRSSRPYKRAVRKTRPTKSRKTIKRKVRARGRAPVVRRRNKAGRIYYFNKRTKRFTKKSNWYKYRTYALKRKPKKIIPVKKKGEKEKLTIDLTSALIKIDLERATDAELREEANRLLLEQARWRGRLGDFKIKDNKDKIHRQLTRYARAINKIKTILGEYQEPRGFDKKAFNIGNVRVDNIYRWEAKKFLDSLLDSERFEIYIVQEVAYQAITPIDIHLAVDDLIIDAEMNGIYYLKFTRNFKEKIVKITLNY